MRLIAILLLTVSTLTLFPVSGIVRPGLALDSGEQGVTVLDVCSQPSSGIFSDAHLPFITQHTFEIVQACCKRVGAATPNPSYDFIHCLEIEYPPET